MAEPVAAPHFVIDSDPDQAGGTVQQVNYFEQKIRENPEAFHKALERLGAAATAGTLDLSAIDTELTTLEQGASGLLTKFFSKRLDLDVEFDTDTEDALAADVEHRKLIQKHRDLHSVNSQTGKMSHEIVANPQAEPTRDAVRRSRMAFFIARTLNYQIQHSSAELPSAG